MPTSLISEPLLCSMNYFHTVRNQRTSANSSVVNKKWDKMAKIDSNDTEYDYK